MPIELQEFKHFPFVNGYVLGNNVQFHHTFKHKLYKKLSSSDAVFELPRSDTISTLPPVKKQHIKVRPNTIPLMAQHYKSTALINIKAIRVYNFDKPVEPKPIRRLRPTEAGPGVEAVSSPFPKPQKLVQLTVPSEAFDTTQRIPTVSSLRLNDEIDHHQEGATSTSLYEC
ncbi:hypothetical protein FQA39_LY08239 [Lamprigera yunnana]|nr:hypothetical protein FQA39_LY08239 [Lamprigera yunnana]